MGTLAHGLGGRSDLPLPGWLFAYGAGFAVLIGAVALGMLWPRPRLAAAAAGRALPGAVQRAARPATVVLRALGLATFAVVVASCFAGPASATSNVGVLATTIAFWVVVPVLAAAVGDVHRALNPLDTLAALTVCRLRPVPPEPTDGAPRPAAPGLWPAAATVLSFLWLRLAYHGGDSPRAVGAWLVAATVAALAGAAVWGRRWSLAGEGFAALFGLLGAIGVLGRGDDGRLRLRPPLAGLAAVRPEPGQAALLLVALGGLAFDGVTGLDRWQRSVGDGRTGWGATAVATAGLLATIALVAAAWLAATRLAARRSGDDHAPHAATTDAVALAPLVVGFVVAHAFAPAVYGAYDLVALASDPFGRGWDLFGTVDVAPDYRLLSDALVAWVQAGAVLAGALAAVAVVHDRALARHRRPSVAARAVRPTAAAVAAFAVAGLLLFLGA